MVLLQYLSSHFSLTMQLRMFLLKKKSLYGNILSVALSEYESCACSGDRGNVQDVKQVFPERLVLV